MFKLNIECTKDINELRISFADGTSVITTNDANGIESSKIIKQDTYLDTDSDWSNVSQEIIKPPEIIRENKPIKVANELHNFDF